MQEPEAPLDDKPISEMVTEALVRHGIDAVVVERNDGIELYGPNGKPLWIDAAKDIAAWSTLPPAIRQRKAHALATRLAHMYQSQATADEPERRFPPLERFLPLGVGLGLGILAFLGFRLTREKPVPPPPPNSASETAEQRRFRLSRACEATRAMFWKGGAWGSMPLEGWVVELWIAKRGAGSLMTEPAVSSLVANGKLSAKADGALAAIGDGAASLEDGAADASIPGVKLVFSEGYARSFFEIDKRDRFVGLGERLVRETKADYGALWARCSHQTAREIGAWFYGKDAKNAAAALLFVMGRPQGAAVSEHRPVAADFGAISALAARVEEPSFLSLVQADGARASTNEGISLFFPFDPQTRAGQSSKNLAEKLGF